MLLFAGSENSVQSPAALASMQSSAVESSSEKGSDSEGVEDVHATAMHLLVPGPQARSSKHRGPLDDLTNLPSTLYFSQLASATKGTVSVTEIMTMDFGSRSSAFTTPLLASTPRDINADSQLFPTVATTLPSRISLHQLQSTTVAISDREEEMVVGSRSLTPSPSRSDCAVHSSSHLSDMAVSPLYCANCHAAIGSSITQPRPSHHRGTASAGLDVEELRLPSAKQPVPHSTGVFVYLFVWPREEGIGCECVVC